MKILINFFMFIFLVISIFFGPSTALAQTTPCCPQPGFSVKQVPNGLWVCEPTPPVRTFPVPATLCNNNERCDQSGSCLPLTGIQGVFGKIAPPAPLLNLTMSGGAAGISLFLSNVVQLIFIVAGIIFLFMVIIGAVQWILSGGDKEAVGNARKRITHAIIGIVLLSLVFVIVKLIGQITGFTFF